MKRLPSIATLRLFIQVAKSASFSETARVAAISQPALSRTIRLLEEELGVRLFDRDTRNVRLTSAGETLLPAVQRLVREFEDTFGELEQSFSGKRGHVVIGALPSVAAKMLPLALVDFCTANPDIELTVREGLSDDLYQQMRDRQIDLAIVTPPDRADQFDFVAMLEDECVLVCREGDLPARRGAYLWRIFEERPFISMAPHSSVRRLADIAFAQAKITVRPRFECAQLATVGGFIVAGLGISAVPHSTLPLVAHSGIAVYPLSDPLISRTIGLAKPSQRALSPAARLLENHLAGHLLQG